jgi:hypothetical protein
MPENKVPREVTLLQRSAERLVRAYKTPVFDKKNLMFIKRETRLHLKMTLRLLMKVYRGR